MSFRGRKRSAATLASAIVSVALVAGCGGGKDFADQPRPAAPIQLNGVINSQGVQISPWAQSVSRLTRRISRRGQLERCGIYS